MTLSGALMSSAIISWKSSGRLQQTIRRCVEVSGKGLHSGNESTVRLSPEYAQKGRYFDFHSKYSIPASIDFAQQNSPLCTTLSADRFKVRTVEHLLSALEATGIDNCKIQIFNNNVDSEEDDCDFEIPILDGSAKQWVEAIEKAGLVVAVDESGNSCERMAPYLNEPVYVCKNDSFVAAIPSPNVRLTYGIDFSKVCAIGCQWFSLAPLDDSFYVKQIASSRTFCIYEEVEQMRNIGLIKGGTLQNAIVCSASKGWLNPPLRFPDEPCRHKILDLIGDLSLFARLGNQGLPVAHIIAYKGGHALHADFVCRLNDLLKK
ncbi:hypothetical protein P3X46_026534 [Hevea brasiliensis]|uniref:UDP-3-O-acyl-N-acetylglucosamine deacetylase n=1 Tax=Hevea brasiliensis TaxID=3981 RepID=A0ABQ9KWX4_HEVBR|nr:probable UDP-3-O-acyl-N-acetylglucosamine deacetylase 1, mitochondrial [Hevea brasiliensis]KAJ9153045.1 hypothetical protein P3X46_026534 [Hevea brasiliensis]